MCVRWRNIGRRGIARLGSFFVQSMLLDEQRYYRSERDVMILLGALMLICSANACSREPRACIINTTWQQIGTQNYDKFSGSTLLHNYELDNTTANRTN